MSWCGPSETNSLSYSVVHLEKRNDKRVLRGERRDYRNLLLVVSWKVAKWAFIRDEFC